MTAPLTTQQRSTNDNRLGLNGTVSATGQGPTECRRRLRGSWRRITGAIVTATTAVALLAGTASADTFRYASGSPGPSRINEPGVTCNWPASQIQVKPPSMWAKDFHYGYGNDKQWVRFRSQEFDWNTGQNPSHQPLQCLFFGQRHLSSPMERNTDPALLQRRHRRRQSQIYMQRWMPRASSRFGDTTREADKYYGYGYPGFYGGPTTPQTSASHLGGPKAPGAGPPQGFLSGPRPILSMSSCTT
jgi:hypothetical protein